MLKATERRPAETPRKQARGRCEHLWAAIRRHAYTRRRTRPPTTLGKALDVLWPWSAANYPGMVAGAAQTFQDRVKRETIASWRNGRRRAPKWAWGLIAIEAEKRAQELLRVAELAKKEAGD